MHVSLLPELCLARYHHQLRRQDNNSVPYTGKQQFIDTGVDYVILARCRTPTIYHGDCVVSGSGSPAAEQETYGEPVYAKL